MKFVLDYDVYLKKVEGCWLGKSLAGVIGAPFEAQKIFEELGSDNLWPKTVYPNDDLDIQVVWLEMMEDVGTDITYNHLEKFWRDRCWYNFAEYGYFLYNVQRGIHAPVSGDFNNSFFRESEGCPIRAEIWGLVSPGNPKLASEYAYMDGTLDHVGASVHAEMFWAAANAHALVCSDLDQIVNAGLSVLPAESEIRTIVSDVKYVVNNCSSLKEMWINLIRLWGDRDSSKSQINFAFSLLPLYCGDMDFKKTMAIACSLTFDTDCTAGTACSLLGTIIGADAFPADWLEKLGKDLTCDVNARHKDLPILEFAKDTVCVGIEAMLNKNYNIEITGIPDDVMDLVKNRLVSRESKKLIEINSVFEGEVQTSLEPDAFYLPIAIENKSFKDISGILTAYPVDKERNMTVEICENFSINVCANSICKSLVLIKFDTSERIIWDKNLVSVNFQTEDKVYSKELGVIGARVWNVYGPYWDIYDTDKYDICPFRNSEINEHPHRVGVTHAIFHQWVKLDNKYLDEKKLLSEEIKEEFPFTINLAEDIIKKEDISKNMGESCYYFTRELVSTENRDINFFIGSTGPFKLYVNGKEIYKNEECIPYSPQDYIAGMTVEKGKTYRIVVKVLQLGDDFKFAISPMMNPIPESKEYGKSFVLDTFGNKF